VKEQSNPDNNQPTESGPNDVALRERIEKQAYHLWLTSGGGHGEHLNHWLQAEGEVLQAIKQEQRQRSTARKTRPVTKQRSSRSSNEALPNK
jgi:hypothetical protein